eukprot:353231-Chlamydomonas_euryale.AAC.4
MRAGVSRRSLREAGRLGAGLYESRCESTQFEGGWQSMEGARGPLEGHLSDRWRGAASLGRG